ncbi:MAG: transposase [Pseudomonadota bacterium]
MSQYVGLDVSLKSVSICVVAAEGAVTPRGETSADPDQIASFIAEHAPRADRVVHESGVLAIWLTRALHALGVPIVRIDARQAHKVLSARLNKSDVEDAEGLAHLARTGWFSRVHVRSEASERVRVPIGTRERLIRMRKDLEGHVRGVLKVFGVCMGTVHRARLRQGFAINAPRRPGPILRSAPWQQFSTRPKRHAARRLTPWTMS